MTLAKVGALLVFWAACSAQAPSVPQRTAPVHPPADACRVANGGELRCSLAGQAERVVALPFPVHAAVPRASGGAYALGEQGELVRIAPRGRITGAFETELVSLVAATDYVCGVDTHGDVVCARDHHHDRSCPGLAMPAWRRVAITPEPVSQLRLEARSGRLCARTDNGREQCADVRATCNRFCLSYPACAPLHCIDPCEPSEG